MSKVSRINRKFERFLGYNFASENRFDHVGALHDEKDWSRELQRRQNRENYFNQDYHEIVLDIQEHKIIAQSVYNHRSGKDTMYHLGQEEKIIKFLCNLIRY